MKPFDRVVVLNDAPGDKVAKGDQGIIVDMSHTDFGINVSIELDEDQIPNPNEDDGFRTVEAHNLKVTYSDVDLQPV
jgi:hypothetical protein